MEGKAMVYNRKYQSVTGKNKFKQPQFDIDVKAFKICLLAGLKAFGIALLIGFCVVLFFITGV